jgi:hypothetical protein
VVVSFPTKKGIDRMRQHVINPFWTFFLLPCRWMEETDQTVLLKNADPPFGGSA